MLKQQLPGSIEYEQAPFAKYSQFPFLCHKIRREPSQLNIKSQFSNCKTPICFQSPVVLCRSGGAHGRCNGFIRRWFRTKRHNRIISTSVIIQFFAYIQTNYTCSSQRSKTKMQSRVNQYRGSKEAVLVVDSWAAIQQPLTAHLPQTWDTHPAIECKEYPLSEK